MKEEKMRVPDIYIMGVQKAGTTTLYDWLAQHPEIYAHPMAKDFPYFSDDRTHKEGKNLFLSFAKNISGEKYVLGGEANAMYGANGAKRMYQTMPKAKLIVILRNPIERAYSAYTYAVERLMEERTFAEAIADELKGISYKPHDALQRDYLKHGQYATQLHKVLQFFPIENIKVVIFEELKHDPKQVLSEIFQFVGVVNDFTPDMNIKNQTKGGSRSKLIARLTHGNINSNFIRKVGKAIIPYNVRTAIRRKLTDLNRIDIPKQEFPDSLQAILRDYYQKEIEELEMILEKRIQQWYS